MLKLKPDEMTEISRFAKEHPTGRLLSEMRDWKFNVGDVLIRTIKDMHANTSAIDMVSDTCQVPKKYKVVYLDALGVPWLKQLSVRGGLGMRMYCLATVDPGRYHYMVDPEQLEASLLGYRYDARVEYKKMRNDNPSYGAGVKNETK
jgi:hypothetical protein